MKLAEHNLGTSDLMPSLNLWELVKAEAECFLANKSSSGSLGEYCHPAPCLAGLTYLGPTTLPNIDVL